MIAETISVGTELLLGQILNKNAQYLAAQYPLLGLDHYHQVTVGDNRARLVEALRVALDRADVVVTTGGLGPTMDDLTRDAVSDVSGRRLVLDPAALAELERFFSRRGLLMSENVRSQALRLEGAELLPNVNGTAPGQALDLERGGRRRLIILLPGPPNEMIPMFEQHAVPRLRAFTGEAAPLVSRTLRFAGIGESHLESMLDDLMRGQTDPSLAPYARLGEVEIRVTTRSQPDGGHLARLASTVDEIRRRAGEHLFSEDGASLEETVIRLAAARGVTLATAESCTGGLVAKRLTDVPGSSAVFKGGVVAYANELKRDLLGVPEGAIVEHGAVSEPVACAMAKGARRLTGAALAVSLTGVAGPGGGSADKPVGLVWIALATPIVTRAQRYQWGGLRDDIRNRAAQEALTLLWRALRAAPGPSASA